MSSIFSENSDWDIVFKTTDGILFNIDSSKIPHGAFPARPTSGDSLMIDIAETSSVLSVILHALYNAAFNPTDPSMDLLDEAIDRMPFHGVEPAVYITPGSELYRLLLRLASDDPYRVFTLAAFHELQDLATEASRFTLPIPLTDVPEHQAERMGAVYFKRLFMLHHNRTNLLRDIVVFSPSPHPRTQTCGNDQYITMSRAWSLRVAELLLSDYVLSGITIDQLHDWFMTLGGGISCEFCLESLKSRIGGLTSKWALTKNTI